MTNRILDFHFFQDSAIVQLYEESVSDRSLLRLVVFGAEPFIFGAFNLGA
jgi:hypothetical protein